MLYNEYRGDIDEEHICCAIGDPKHQDGVDKKKEWIKSKLKDVNEFKKLMQESFQYEYETVYGSDKEQVLPDKDID